MQPARLIIQKMMKYEKYIKSILSTIVLNEKKIIIKVMVVKSKQVCNKNNHQVK